MQPENVTSNCWFVPRSLLLAILALQSVILVVLVLHLFAAWQYKARWIDLAGRVERLEASSVPVDATKPK